MRSRQKILSPATQAVHGAFFAKLFFPAQMDDPRNSDKIISNGHLIHLSKNNFSRFLGPSSCPEKNN